MKNKGTKQAITLITKLYMKYYIKFCKINCRIIGISEVRRINVLRNVGIITVLCKLLLEEINKSIIKTILE